MFIGFINGSLFAKLTYILTAAMICKNTNNSKASGDEPVQPVKLFKTLMFLLSLQIIRSLKHQDRQGPALCIRRKSRNYRKGLHMGELLFFTGFPVNELQGFAGYQIIRNKTGIIVFSLKR
jgi:hypothetical protein